MKSTMFARASLTGAAKERLPTMTSLLIADEPAAAARKLDALPTFLDGWSHYAAGQFEEALPLFVRCREIDHADVVYGQFIERCTSGLSDTADAALHTKA